jgi:hypothetical protein
MVVIAHAKLCIGISDGRGVGGPRAARRSGRRCHSLPAYLPRLPRPRHICRLRRISRSDRMGKQSGSALGSISGANQRTRHRLGGASRTNSSFTQQSQRSTDGDRARSSLLLLLLPSNAFSKADNTMIDCTSSLARRAVVALTSLACCPPLDAAAEVLHLRCIGPAAPAYIAVDLQGSLAKFSLERIDDTPWNRARVSETTVSWRQAGVLMQYIQLNRYSGTLRHTTVGHFGTSSVMMQCQPDKSPGKRMF